MKYFLILFIFLSFGVKGQTWVTEYESDGNVTVTDSLQADRNPNDFYVDTLGDTSYVMNTPHGRISSKDLSLEEKLLQYAAECWSDTLVLTKIPELPDDYIIEHPHYREVLTEAQLKKQGYEYQHRFLETEYVDGEYKAVGWKYYFVKIPTLAGFAEYLKNK